MSSLRHELLGLPADPDIRLLLPEGWEVLPLDEPRMAQLTSTWRDVLMRAHRPDIDAYLSGALEQWIDELRARGGKFAILPSAAEHILPMSLVVSVISERDGSRLDAWVANRLRGGGAGFLDDAKTILIWEQTTSGTGQMAHTASDQYFYLIPVPGADRRRAVLLTGTNLVSDTACADDPARLAARALYDAIALALTWVDLPDPQRS